MNWNIIIHMIRVFVWVYFNSVISHWFEQLWHGVEHFNPFDFDRETENTFQVSGVWSEGEKMFLNDKSSVNVMNLTSMKLCCNI